MNREISEELIEEAVSNPDNALTADLSDKTVVYFDQKMWGEIRDAKTRTNTESLDQLATRSVEEADFVYPFSLENLIETTSASDTEFKIDVFDLMMELSKNHSIRNYLNVFDQEAVAYVCERYELLAELDTRSYVFGKGTAYTAGEWEIQIDENVPEEQMRQVKEEITKVIRDQEVNRRLLLSRAILDDAPGVSEKDRKEYEERYQKNVQQDGDLLELDDDVERSKYLADVFIERMMPRVRECCRELSLSPLSLILYDPRQMSFEAFFRNFPAFYTYTNLCFAVDAHTDREPDFNDVMDISQLAVAAPYADIVVTEKFFGGMLHRFDIGDVFDTIIYQDVDDFRSFLKSTLD